ncbi:hypothetical protein F4824DRAFT_472225 [Ustulina deusta]|nr:hypothetical protein F4824DRAFT_472225 [Ustulina deusta]
MDTAVDSHSYLQIYIWASKSIPRPRDPEGLERPRIFEASFLNLARFSPRVLRAREACAAAMIKYMEKDGHKSASGLVRARHDHHRYEYNFTLEDVARGELGNTFAVLGNTTPCAYRMASC